MKKVLGVFFIVLATITQVRAEGYNCVNDDNNQEHLTINYLTGNPATVEAILATATGNEVFTGVHGEGNDTLKDSSGALAILDFNIFVSHGGRCGRCTATTISYYAKLTKNQEEKDFTCSPK